MRILIALDDTPASRHAAREAVRLLCTGEGSEVLVVSVAALPMPVGGVEALGNAFPLGAVPIYPTEPAEPVEVELGELAALNPTVLRRHGDPVTEICKAAEEHDVDLVVVGGHHKGVVERLLDPSVVPSLLKRAHRPVLVVPQEALSRT